MAVLLDGTIANGSHGGGIHLHDSDGRPLQTLKAHTRRVTSVQPLPEGRLASASEDGTSASGTPPRGVRRPPWRATRALWKLGPS